MAYLRSVAIALATCLTLAACSDGDTSQGAIATGTPTVSVSIDASAQAAFEAEVAASEKAAQVKFEHVRSQAMSEKSLDRRLGVIVTAYCKTQGQDAIDSIKTSTFRRLLEELFEGLWQAGNTWDRPLWSAAKQHGACPAAFPTSPPTPGG